jgi:2OG-Fe(II) oxygenase superfamily
MECPTTLSPDSLGQLHKYGYVVVPNFLGDTSSLKEDLLNLRCLNHFKVAKIGHDGQVQDPNTPFRDVRVSETCSLWNEDHAADNLPSSVARDALYQLLAELRRDISTNDDVKLDENIQEIMYALYPNGGYYRRHVDAEEATTSMFRTYSFLLYLSDWTGTDGGCLRLHLDGGKDEKPPMDLPCFFDVPPAAGTLVIFRSDLVPHEVLSFYGYQRMVVVGWFWGEASQAHTHNSRISHEPETIEQNSLELLLHLRDIVPNLRSKLDRQSGEIQNANDAWGIVMSTSPSPRSSDSLYSDHDPRYWSKIAKFRPTDGLLLTLSLSGLRCRKLSFDLSGKLDLQALTTLDLSNTDMAPDQMAAFLLKATNLKFVRLGVNDWADHSSIRRVASALGPTVEIMDCRYSNWTAAHLEAFLFPDDCNKLQGLQKLYLEGNSLGDDLGPLVAWMSGSSRLRELYLGQNYIGPDGALQLTQIDCKTLSKLYLEGNQLGACGAKILLQTNLVRQLEKLYAENNDIPKDLSLQLGQALQSPTMIGEGGLFQ